MPCKNKLDASNLFFAYFTWLGLTKIEPFIPTNINHNIDKTYFNNPL